MISPPTMRVDAPHDVVHAVLRLPDSSLNSMPKTDAKFWPSSWLVPICSALPSPVIASHVIVLMAPAKRSRVVLSPTATEIPRTSTMNAS